MGIQDLPQEVLSDIFLLATKANQADGERFTYGLTQALPLHQPKLSRYVRGPVSAESLRWDATNSIRQVCSQWHEWAISYNFEHVFERKWRGSERWANLSSNRRLYQLYEAIHRPSAVAVYRDPYGSLKSTHKLVSSLPAVSKYIRRLWFNGFYTAETDKHILSIVAECPGLHFLSVPWTVLRRATAHELIDLLSVNTDSGSPLQSLELQAVCLPQDQALALENDTAPDPLSDPNVDFSALKRLKFFGNTLHKPITDADLALIARTATHLEALDITNLSTISVAGMLTLVKASHATLQVLEHSPRSDDGFYHPRPGRLDSDEHVCELLTSMPRLRDLSISIPSMCPALFANPDVRWTGDCQVRAEELCTNHYASPTSSTAKLGLLNSTLTAARTLTAAHARVHAPLRIEIFFAGCIFEPASAPTWGAADGAVHGNFLLGEFRSAGAWPGGEGREVSPKGPYGTTGVYGKEDGGGWECVGEKEFGRGVEGGWIEI